MDWRTHWKKESLLGKFMILRTCEVIGAEEVVCSQQMSLDSIYLVGAVQDISCHSVHVSLDGHNVPSLLVAGILKAS